MSEPVDEKELVKSITAQFCQQYYQILDTNRAGLAPLYTDLSVMSFEGIEKVGTKAIMDKLMLLPFQKVEHLATAIDCQATIDNSILISVLGKVKTDDDPVKGFHQSFLLKSHEGKFFIMNDIFRLSLHNF